MNEHLGQYLNRKHLGFFNSEWKKMKHTHTCRLQGKVGSSAADTFNIHVCMCTCREIKGGVVRVCVSVSGLNYENLPLMMGRNGGKRREG